MTLLPFGCPWEDVCKPQAPHCDNNNNCLTQASSLCRGWLRILPPITLMVTIQLGREGVYSGAAPPSSLPQREVQVEVKQV